MLQPSWLVDTLAGVMVATSLYCVARLVAARRWRRELHWDVNIAHVAMGVAMAGMLVADLQTLPTGVWEIVFGGLVFWFANGSVRLFLRQGVGHPGSDAFHHLTHKLAHAVMAGAMLYMFVEGSTPTGASASGAMSAMGGGGSGSDLGVLTLLFTFLLFVSAVWHADGMSRYTTVRGPLVGATVGSGGGAPSPTAGAVPEGTWGSDAGGQEDPSVWLAPRLEMACHIAECVAMGYMLILLL